MVYSSRAGSGRAALVSTISVQVQVPDQNQVFCNSLFPEVAAELSGLAGRSSYSADLRQMLLRIRPLGALTGEIFVIRHVVHSVKLDQRNSFFGVDGRADLRIGRGCLQHLCHILRMRHRKVGNE
jgi:hypothetical protein